MRNQRREMSRLTSLMQFCLDDLYPILSREGFFELHSSLGRQSTKFMAPFLIFGDDSTRNNLCTKCSLEGQSAFAKIWHEECVLQTMFVIISDYFGVCTGKITGLACTPNGDACVSCSLDGSVRLFKVPFAPLEAGPIEKEVSAVLEFQGKFGFRGLDHHWRDNIFATVGERVRICCLSQTGFHLCNCGEKRPIEIPKIEPSFQLKILPFGMICKHLDLYQTFYHVKATV